MIVAPRVPREIVRHEDLLDWWSRLSNEQKAIARAKCRQKGGFTYFASNFLFIMATPPDLPADVMPETPMSGWYRFIPWPKQEELLEYIERFPLIFSVKTRQMAWTWLCVGRSVWTNAAFPNTKVAAISLEQDQRTREVSMRYEQVFNLLPPDLFEVTPTDHWGVKHRVLSNGSTFLGLSTTQYGSAAFVLNGLVIDELGLIEEAGIDGHKLVINAGLGSIRSLRGWGMFGGTGRVQSGVHWEYAKRKIQGKIPDSPADWADPGFFFFPAKAHPYFANGVYERERERMNNDPGWVREYPNEIEEAYMSDGSTVFSNQGLKLLEANDALYQPEVMRISLKKKRVVPTRSAKHDHTLLVWERPRKGKYYYISCDVSEGKAKGDWTVMEVVATDGTHAAEFRCRIENISKVGRYAFVLGAWYNWARQMPEINSDRTVLKKLQRLGYPNIYFTTQPGLSAMDPPTQSYGVRTTKTNRPLFISTLTEEVAKGPSAAWLKIRGGVIGEMKTFVSRVTQAGTVKTGAAHGCHDDRVMALGIAAYGAREHSEALVDQRYAGIAQARDAEDSDVAFEDDERASRFVTYTGLRPGAA